VSPNKRTEFFTKWYTYILQCKDLSLYVGITNNLENRLKLHNAGKAAHWTCIRRPVIMIFAQEFPDESLARKREIEIKGWRREKKLALLSSSSNVLAGEQPATMAIGQKPCCKPRL